MAPVAGWIGLAALLTMLAACEGTPDTPRARPSATQTVAPLTSPTPSPSATIAAASLDQRYEACVRAARFDPGGVQVLVKVAGETLPDNDPTVPTGTPVWVKTGRDVPAAIHRPCLQAIGGKDPKASSYGY